MHSFRRHLSLLAVACAACGGSDPIGSNDGPDGQQSSYDLQLASYTLKGNAGVLTAWDAGSRSLYLGLDEVAEPAGTITIGLGPISSGTNGSRRADVEYAAVTVSPSRTEPGNTENWDLDPSTPSEVTGIRTGDDLIEGTVVIRMMRMVPQPPPGTDRPKATLTGTFRAVQ